MNYKDLKGKTVFDFCNDAEILAKVTGFSAPLESKEYIEGCTPVVHAQMLQNLAIEPKIMNFTRLQKGMRMNVGKNNTANRKRMGV